MSGVRPGSAGAWLLASRPKTLTAALAPVLVGTACAHVAGGVVAATAICAAVGASFIQIGTNFANDVFDYEKGADDETRLGPTRAVQAGLLTPGQMKLGMWVSFALAALAGVALVAIGGWPIVAIGVASVLSGIAYTGGPFPLGYNGLGDVFVMLFFGLVAVCCTTWLQVDTIPLYTWWCAVGVGALATAVLVVNNVRDAVTDVHAGKRTVVVRFGRGFGVAEYVLMWLLALAAPVAVLFTAPVGPLVLLPLLTLPIAVSFTRTLVRERGAALNPLLGKTAGALFLYSVLLSLGLVLGANA